MSNSFIEKIGGRKFIVALYSLVASSVLLYLQSIDQDTYKAIVMGVILFYISGNVGQKVFVKNTTPTDPSSITNAVGAINSAISNVGQSASSATTNNGASS
jgi:uncharacterized membrane protein YjjP (DUF1212 family)